MQRLTAVTRSSEFSTPALSPLLAENSDFLVGRPIALAIARILVGRTGFEPVTPALRGRCSTAKLTAQKIASEAVPINAILALSARSASSIELRRLWPTPPRLRRPILPKL